MAEEADMTKVISLGGSIVAPDAVDVEFLHSLRELFIGYFKGCDARRVILVIGGGGPARKYQAAYRQLTDKPDNDAQDWIGIAATRLNGELVRAVFSDYCPEPLVTDPSAVSSFKGRVLVAAGWKPGFSSDYDAVVLAERFGADTVINLSNISKVYSADPKLDPTAAPLDSLSWKDFKTLVGDVWTPGKNLPFDPIAAGKAAVLHLRVICAAGKDLPNLGKILADEPFIGTTLGPA